MKRSTLAAAALVLVAASTAQAQAPTMARPFTFGVSAGAAIPTGELAKNDPEFDCCGASTGYHINGLIGYQPATMPIGFRGEIMYNRFGLKNLPSGVDGNGTIFGGSVNAVVGGASSVGVSPYFIGGVDYAQFKGTLEEGGVSISGKASGFGLNGGVGIKIPLSGFQTFVEARYHYLFTKDDNAGTTNGAFVPVSFGIMF
jgi:opacity protein-like surface antigen